MAANKKTAPAKPAMKKFARVVDGNLVKDEIEIADDAEAAKFCLEHEKIYFETFEIPNTPMALLCRDIRNMSERNYVGLSEVFTKAAAKKSLLAPITVKLSPAHRAAHQQAVKEALIALNDEPDDALLVKRLGRAFEFIRLNDGDTVYNLDGEKIWPAPQ